MNRVLLLFFLLFTNTVMAQVDLNLGLRAYYPFTGNANDVSGNNNNPVFNNATLTTDRFGNPNSAYLFNGIDNYMRIPNSPTLNTTNKISVAAWVKVSGFYNGTCHGNSIVMKGDGDYLPGNYALRFDDNPFTNAQNCVNPVVDVTHQNFYGVNLMAASPGYTPYIQTGTWMNVIYTSDGTTSKLYVNCELKISAPAGSLSFTNTYDLYFGKMNDASFPYWLNGAMDEVRIYDRALNQDEINVLGGCVSSLTCNNWAYLPSYQSYIGVGDLDVPGTTITVEAVFNRTAPYTGGYNWAGDLVSKHVDPTDANYLLRPNNAEITTSNGYFSTPPVCEIVLNKTYHAAMVYDGTTLKFYRNGFLMSSVPATGTMFQNNHATRIGLYDAVLHNTNLIGYINEVRIWNTARSQSQIQANMNGSLASPATQPGLQAYYTFDNLLNKQGNPAWNGTLGGSATINATNPNCNFVADSCLQRANISNIINTYTPVISLDVCTNKITVEDAGTFNTGDTVLMIQMKGAVIDSTNTAAFGTITDYKNAGNYEFNYVKSKTGNIIELKNVLTRQYDLPGGKVQLVRVPYYQDAFVASTLTCLPWDGSKGGVLVLNVADSVILGANIDVSGKGFKGGNVVNQGNFTLACNENNYYYANDPTRAAPKGEGIAMLSPSRSFGKGALANGGGGGIGHNSGGGGGANGSIGGMGGKEWISCSPVLVNGGIGGLQLAYSNPTNKIFLGGGGGAGQCDNLPRFNSLGGNGGGLIIIQSTRFKANGFSILANGAGGAECIRDAQPGKCHEGMGGGGSGGTVLANVNTFLDPLPIQIRGGKGADMNGETQGKLGPGGGGSGGVTWFTSGTLPAGITIVKTGGVNGINIDFAGDSWGATPGATGMEAYGLVIPVDNTPFRPNIDSVRFNFAATGCSSFDFHGLGYTNTNPVQSWQWFFGDLGTANTQDASHTYLTTGTYTVKLIVTDINGCKDSIMRDVSAGALDFDFSYQRDACNPLSVTFNGVGASTTNPYWSFGDGNTNTSSLNPVNLYPATGSYLVKYSVESGACRDTVYKTINLELIQDNIILTTDTTICPTATKKLRTIPALGFCWTPATYLDNPLLAEPTTSTPQNITYYFTAQIPGNNLITNGNFNAGNTGFTSQYTFATPNVTEGQYFVGPNPQAWNASLSNCPDHTTGTGNMLLVNGAPVADVNVWKQTIAITPNTNYAFSTWIQALYPPNPAQLQFSINGNDVGSMITASLPTCTWTQFFTTWNSGGNTSATISIVNKNTLVQGNDFALDDISFAPVLFKRDSVKITVDAPAVVTNNNTPVCEGSTVQLNTTGAVSYSWTPTTGLSNPNIGNPIATPLVTTQYIVTGINANGCSAKDTVVINVSPLPVVTITNDTSICANTSVQLQAGGGSQYAWTPGATLSSVSAPNPIASPTTNTLYYVTVTSAAGCKNLDSVQVDIVSPAQFSVDPDKQTCFKTPIQLHAAGGDVYSWTPSSTLDDPNIPNPVANPISTTTYLVTITENKCNVSAVLPITVSSLPLPVVKANRSNDIDCSTPQSQLIASGAAQYSWTPAGTLSNPNSGTTIATPTITTKYFVSGTNVAGCTNKDSVIVKVDFLVKAGYLMPNGFTPNNDGKNDCYGLKYWGTITQLEFSIYNRWGELLFYTTDPNQCWDGRHKGVPQDPAVFVYMIKAKTTCEPQVFRKGTFVLIR